MAQFVATLPQREAEIKVTTIQDLVRILPEEIEYPIEVWIGGNIARFGITTGNLIFLVDCDGEPSPEARAYFSGLAAPLGISATVGSNWKDQSIVAVKLYNDGKLLLDRETGSYRGLPVSRKIPILTAEEMCAKLPAKVPWTFTTYLTGGLVKNGWTANDVDFLILEPTLSRPVIYEMKKFFTRALGWRTDVGQLIMADREPVYLYKIYEQGKLCLQ